MKTGKAGEIVGTGVWAASAVAVAGYTFSAYKNTYSQFPAPGGGGGKAISSSPLDKANQIKTTDNAVKKIPLIGPAIAAGSQGFRRLFNKVGWQSLTDKETGRLQKLPAPPRPLVEQIKKNAAMRNASQQQAVLRAANELKYWALQHGWKSTDVNAYINFLGVRVFGPGAPS